MKGFKLRNKNLKKVKPKLFDNNNNKNNINCNDLVKININGKAQGQKGH